MSATDNLGPQFYHGSLNRIEPAGTVHTRAMALEYGWLQHNYFTTDRHVAADFADARNGRDRGYIHVVQPTGPYEVDPGEPDSFKSRHPLRVLSGSESEA